MINIALFTGAIFIFCKHANTYLFTIPIFCKVSSYGLCYNVMTRVGLSCRTGQRRPPMRGRQRANYGFESWKTMGASGLGTIRTTPYCNHRQPASALGFCGIANAPELPQQNSHWREEYQVQLARLESENR